MNQSNNNRKLYIICNNIRSLYNVGSILRTSDAVGIVTKIYFTGITGYPKQNDLLHHQNLRIAKTSLGAEKYLNYEYIKDTTQIINKLKKNKIYIYSLENNIKHPSINEYSKTIYNFPMALIIGNELHGIDKSIINLSDHCVYIPMNGKKESLNVASAYAIAVYEILKQFSAS
jgi:tRNA G18 (ribose-2'-O)-methylase SpoU